MGKEKKMELHPSRRTNYAGSSLPTQDVRKESPVAGFITLMIRGDVGLAVQRTISRTCVLEEGASRGGFEKGGGKGKDSSKGISKMTKKEEARGSEETGGSPKEDDKTSEVGTETDVMKNLLEEANKMLKSMTMKDQKEDKMAALQRQVEELRKMKVFRLTKMGKPEHAERIDRQWSYKSPSRSTT